MSEFEKVFDMFDYQKSDSLSRKEMATCISLICGGSVNQKMLAAFKLFDKNNSMTLNYEELYEFIECVFTIFESVKKDFNIKNQKSIWQRMNMHKLT